MICEFVFRENYKSYFFKTLITEYNISIWKMLLLLKFYHQI